MSMYTCLKGDFALRALLQAPRRAQLGTTQLDIGLAAARARAQEAFRFHAATARLSRATPRPDHPPQAVDYNHADRCFP